MRSKAQAKDPRLLLLRRRSSRKQGGWTKSQLWVPWCLLRLRNLQQNPGSVTLCHPRDSLLQAQGNHPASPLGAIFPSKLQWRHLRRALVRYFCSIFFSTQSTYSHSSTCVVAPDLYSSLTGLNLLSGIISIESQMFLVGTSFRHGTPISRCATLNFHILECWHWWALLCQ